MIRKISQGNLVKVKSNYPDKDVFCWLLSDDKINKVDCRILKRGSLGLYLGLWHLKTNGLNWHRIMIGKEVYLFTADQFYEYVEPTYTH